MTTTTYYEGLNQRLLHAVPLSARRILEVGCGSGRLAEALKQQQPRRFVCGVELNPAAAAIAASRLDRVWCGDVAEVLQTMDEGHFDCVVFGDVLEHLPDPAEVLRLARRALIQPDILPPAIHIYCLVSRPGDDSRCRQHKAVVRLDRVSAAAPARSCDLRSPDQRARQAPRRPPAT